MATWTFLFEAMEEPYNKTFTAGDHLIIELHCQDIFEGDFVEGGRNRVDLSNTKQLNNPNDVLGNIYSFYRSEIKDIYKFDDGSQSVNAHNGFKVINVTQDEYEQLQCLIGDVTYLKMVDKCYYDAVKRLSQAEVVGVAALGVVHDQTSVLKLLAMCTWKHAYLFDLINIQKKELHKELRDIFENKYICKVMHKAGTLTAILFNKYNVYVRNIFDTQVCDLIIEKNSGKNILNTQTKTLPQCLNCYLNLPIYLLHEASAVNWEDRPLSREQKLFGAQLVAFLIFLKEKMEKVLFHNVFKSMEDVCAYYHNLDDSKFAEAVTSVKVPDEVKMLIR